MPTKKLSLAWLTLKPLDNAVPIDSKLTRVSQRKGSGSLWNRSLRTFCKAVFVRWWCRCHFRGPSLRTFILYHQKWCHNGAAPAFHQSFSHETGAVQCSSHLISNTPRSGHCNCSPDKLLVFVLDAEVTSLVLHVPCRAPFAWVRPWVQALSQGLWVAAPRR